MIYLTKMPIEMFPETEKINTLAHGSFSINIKYGIDILNSVIGNIEYKKILSILNKMDTTKYDIALYKSKKIIETGTSRKSFIRNKYFNAYINKIY